MPESLPNPVPVKEPLWKWIVDDPKKAVRLAFFVLALVGYDQWAASRVTAIKESVGDAALKADKNATAVDDLFNVIKDVKLLVGTVQAKQEETTVLLKSVAPKSAKCECGNLCPCGK